MSFLRGLDEEFAGLPVVCVPGAGKHGRYQQDPQEVAAGEPLPEPGAAAWRLRVDDHASTETFAEHVARFCDIVDSTKVTALIVGSWGHGEDSRKAVAALTRERFPAVRHLFFADISSEESEISWILHHDVTPLFENFPLLETLIIKGGEGLRMSPVTHNSLRRIQVRSGGLSGGFPRGLGGSTLPALEHLELWLGMQNYGGTMNVGDVEGILGGAGLPSVRWLGLMNSEMQDAVAAAVATAPVVAQLEHLDLSMGTMGDPGAEALLTGQPLTHLKSLNLDHHYISDALVARVEAAFAGTGVQLSVSEDDARDDWGDYEEEDEEDQWRFTQVSE